MSNYKIRVLDEEFYMILTDEEYRGIALLATRSGGAVEINPVVEYVVLRDNICDIIKDPKEGHIMSELDRIAKGGDEV